MSNIDVGGLVLLALILGFLLGATAVGSTTHGWIENSCQSAGYQHGRQGQIGIECWNDPPITVLGGVK